MANEWVRATGAWDAIGSGHTSTNLMNFWTNFLTNAGTGWVVPAWSTNPLDRYFVRGDHGSQDTWHFTGDGGTQRCGIRITYQASPARLFIRTFVENIAQTADQISSPVGDQIVITVDSTAPNNYLIVGGEHGIYFECGRDGDPTNLGMGMILTHTPIPELYGTKDSQRKWSAQGMVCHLLGYLVFGQSGHTECVITNDGSARAFTAWLQPYVARGTSSVLANTQADSRRGWLGHRDAWYGIAQQNSSNPTEIRNHCHFCVFSSPQDGRYKISPLLFRPALDVINVGTSIGAGSTTGTGSGNYATWRDIRSDRQVKRFACCDYTVLPFANIQDTITSVVYRVGRVADGGRTSNVAVEWPSTIITPAF